MDRFVTDHTFLTHLLSSCLELRLDQCHHFSTRAQKLAHRFQHLGQRDKCYINRSKFNRLADLLRCHITNIRLFHADHPLILAKLPCQLSVSHVYSKDLLCSILQHTVRKSAGG